MRALARPFAAIACSALLAAPAAVAESAGPGGETAPGVGVCRASSAPEALPSTEALLRLQARLQAEADAAGSEAPIVLNGRGYNYGTPRDPLREMQILQAERARAGAQP